MVVSRALYHAPNRFCEVVLNDFVRAGHLKKDDCELDGKVGVMAHTVT